MTSHVAADPSRWKL